MQKFVGIVQEGTKRAAALGFPTVNISLNDPAVSGIYAAKVIFDGTSYIAAAFADPRRDVLEAHIIDAHLELYGKEISIELHKKIRNTKVLKNDDDLHSAIANDILAVREFFRKV